MEICAYCGKPLSKSIGHINRAKKQGLKVYCDRICSGMGRRANLSILEKKLLKSEYDKRYRALNKERIKVNKQEYFKKTYDPISASIKRKARMPSHILYCRTEKYKEYKRNYDKSYRAKKIFGEYWECHILINELSHEYDNREIKNQSELINKSQKRKRLWQQKTKIKNYQQRI